MKSPWDWSDLENLYIHAKTSCPDIAKLKGCHKRTVYDALERAGIKRRSKSEAANIAKSNLKHDWSNLKDLYLNQQLSAREIAKIKDSDPTTVRRALNSHSMATRTRSEAAILAFQKQRRVNPNSSKRGSKSRWWKGGRYIGNSGYAYVHLREHSMANKNGYVPEHRLVMAEFLSRPLESWEIVHHLNGIKSDNRIDNLILVNNHTHERDTMGIILKKEIKKLQSTIESNKKDIRLLKWQMKQLQEQLQGRLV